MYLINDFSYKSWVSARGIVCFVLRKQDRWGKKGAQLEEEKGDTCWVHNKVLSDITVPAFCEKDNRCSVGA